MVFITIKRILEISKVNPYLTLGIKKDASFSEIKNKFRQKILEARNDGNLRARVCLAYDILVNKSYYWEVENDFYIFQVWYNAAYYFTIIGDCLHLIQEIKDEPRLLNFKDPLKRNLLYIAARNGHVSICEYLINKGIAVNEIQHTGSTALHGAAYYGQLKVVKLLLNYGANINIKNNFGHLPKDEAMTEDIKNLLNEFENDPIGELYQILNSKNISKKLIDISYNGKIIAKKYYVNCIIYQSNINLLISKTHDNCLAWDKF